MARRVPIPHALLAAVLLGGTLLAAGPARSAQLEGVLEPGDVIKGHAEAEADCKNCHSGFNKSQQDELCVRCHTHEDIGRDLAERKGYHGKMKRQACAACHADHKGRNANIVPLDEKKFDHDLTSYPLKDKHKEVKCEKCHVPQFKKHREAPKDCYSCHKKDDKHKGAVGEKCEECHNAKSWKEKDVHYDHDKTKFKLRGAHADPKVLCEDCHPKDHYKKTPLECNACHKQDDDKKGHRGRFGPKCENCHTDKDWKTIKFDHDKDTKYPLRGAHADKKKVKCHDCHTGLDVYKDKVKTTCIACHQKDDKHRGVEGNRCEDCHLETDWKTTKDKFDHGLTRFPLLGRHADAKKVKCEDCHKSQAYATAPMDCWSCHEKDDKHKRRLGKLCEPCHNAVDWKRWDFDHDTRTRFKIDGAHKKLNCYDCHSKAVDDAKLPMVCVSCHNADDVHAGSFGKQCERCHVTKNWRTVKARVTARDTFPLAQAMPWVWWFRDH